MLWLVQARVFESLILLDDAIPAFGSSFKLLKTILGFVFGERFRTVEPFLPQIPKSYLRIKDGKMTVRLLMKYLVNKLRLEHESQEHDSNIAAKLPQKCLHVN
ncbi:unnamed protein product [Arabis nemorensis]|uniref:Uncharacterized protein n=1 Tax=Arabis nemorensis TaxID=586526 RepID=A0A565CLD2_9BRAS|nr:unnamed protein product [Arabis nemorensis]